MSIQLIINNSMTIKASVQRVWDALTNPDQTMKYMYGCRVVSDLKVGRTMLWKGVVDGKEMIFVQGHVVSVEPEKNLVYTVFDPNSDIEDIPENYLTVTYTLDAQEDGQTLLTITQGDYSKVANGEQRYVDAMAAGGWMSLMTAIKTLLETS